MNFFAYFDNLLRYKPHINTLTSEAYIAFAVNRTGDWLKEKSDEEVEILVAKARKEGDLRKQFKQRQTIIINRRRETLEVDRQPRQQQMQEN